MSDKLCYKNIVLHKENTNRLYNRYSNNQLNILAIECPNCYKVFLVGATLVVTGETITEAIDMLVQNTNQKFIQVSSEIEDLKNKRKDYQNLLLSSRVDVFTQLLNREIVQIDQKLKKLNSLLDKYSSILKSA